MDLVNTITDEQAEKFLRLVEGGKTNKVAAQKLRITVDQVKRYRAADQVAGGDFSKRWATASGAQQDKTMVGKMRQVYSKIFEEAGVVDKFVEILHGIPMYARFEYCEKAGRRTVREVSHEKPDGAGNDWQYNPDYTEAIYFNLRHVMPTLVPKLGVAKVEHTQVLGTKKSREDIESEGRQLAESIVHLMEQKRESQKFQEAEFEVYERDNTQAS